MSVWSILDLDGEGILACLVVGIPATIASIMYNPGGCCGGLPTSGQLKQAAIATAVAALASLVYLTLRSVELSTFVRWETLDEFTCCPAGASEISVRALLFLSFCLSLSLSFFLSLYSHKHTH